jgi:hypothetical protein
VNLAGEALKGRLVREVYAGSRAGRVLNLYGPSEDTTYSTAAVVGRIEQREPSIGRAISNKKTYVMSDEMQLAPIGVVGELYIGGVGLARGYVRRPEQTAERFAPNPYGSEGERIYATGDAVRFSSRGEIEYLRRKDYQVKVRGYRIEPGEIEAELSRHERVKQAVVMVRGEQERDKRLVAYVVPEGETTAAELKEYLKSRVPIYMLPAAYIMMGQMPLTSNGKVDRRDLPDPGVVNTQRVMDYLAPRSELEQSIAGIWQDVLNVDQVGVNSNFFDLGGHSLLIPRIQMRIQELVNKRLSIIDFFSYPTISSLSECLSGQKVEPTLLQQSSDRAQARRQAIKALNKSKSVQN